ncbi:DUF2283 domain-containing protein [Thermococcus sp. LS2]|uniref:DUF2283 domain-containing protein n=1 Tax=Thermococcus sp. LS2 TaxID=1638260 RepID=UPI00143B4180|nr:DUF2283 domain-containing protein [Thermococcus sp. LS2]NJE12893.1 DUF2283 domain-containing protein [Thermococcus sp. LS2]
MKNKVKIIDYDPLGDSLFVRIPEGKYQSSVQLGDIILDLGKINDELAVIGFEILDASKKFKISPYLLSRGIQQLHAEIRITEKEIVVSVFIQVLQRGKRREDSMKFLSTNEGLPPLTATI